MEKLPARLNHLLFPVLLVVITVAIAVLNFTPGTYLSGWDTLHPEFNFLQNFKNILFGVFRSDQGLGAIAAHSHMSELPRLAVLWLLSLVFDTSFIRYAFFYLCLILGPLGIYFFAKNILQKPKHSMIPAISAFLAALYYIFNLGTVQHFYVPFEMFAVQYAAIGFLFLFAKKYFTTSSKKSLALFSVISFFAAPMAYAALLWYAYFAGLLLFIGTYFLLNINKEQFKRSVVLVVFILMTNAFWILPNLYFLKTAASEVPNAQSNKLFSEEAFLHNKQYGTLADTAIYRNYLFNWRSVETEEFKQSPGMLLHAWHDHLENPFVTAIGYAAFLCVITGIIFAIITRNPYGMSLIPVGLVAFIMIINMNPPFEFFFAYLRENISLFKEGLRFPFTKFSILLMLAFSIYFAMFWNTVLSAFTKRFSHIPSRYLLFVSTAIISTLLLTYGFPMFKGQLINPNMRVQIPESYFELYKWMEDRPIDARIAPLPIHSLWGWEYYKWGFQGAGFTWFGLSQPYLARDFDRWNPNNEQYYREMSTALYSRDSSAIENIARKHHISYFLLDESVTAPGSRPNALWIRETKETFNRSNLINLEKQFGHLSLYSVTLPEKTESFLYAPKEYVSVGPDLTGGHRDQASQDYPVYIPGTTPTTFYPARNLIDRYGKLSHENITLLSDEQLILNFDEAVPDTYSINPDWLSEDIFPETLIEQELKLAEEFKSTVYKIDDTVFVAVPISSQQYSVKDHMQQNFTCIHPSTPEERVTTENDSVALNSLGGETCSYMVFPDQNLDLGQLIIIKAENVSGVPLRICITENISRKCDVYTALERGEPYDTYYYVVPPMPSGLDGYVVHFNNVSIGNTETINKIHSVQVVTLPYYRIQNVKLNSDQQPSSLPNPIRLASFKAINPVTTKFAASNTSQEPGLVVYTKSFAPGWKLYTLDNGFLSLTLPFIFATEIDTHTPVNSWANGWLLDNTDGEKEYMIVYLPQHFQYLGLIISSMSLIFVFATLIYSKNRSLS